VAVVSAVADKAAGVVAIADIVAVPDPAAVQAPEQAFAFAEVLQQADSIRGP
jgi:hypothetical protein